MTATNHTEHYGLSQYTEDDHPTYTGDYNSDMSKIDAAIYAASQSGGGGMATVAHTADLTGDGSTGNPLGVADTIARTEDIPSLDGYATTESVTQAIAAAIADRLTAGDIKAGSGINIETSGNQVTISYVGGGSAGGLAAVAHDATLTGDGTSGTPLGVTQGFFSFAPELKDVTLSDVTESGVFRISGYVESDNPYDGSLTAAVVNIATINTITQIVYAVWMNGNTPRICFRNKQGNSWSAWQYIQTGNSQHGDSTLANRVTALESRVAALTAAATPASTGLTAEQLDSQYSDGYNIIRVGTPTQLDESEVDPNE